MKKLLWSPSRLNVAKKILSRFNTLNGALPELAESLGFAVSKSSIKKAFIRNNDKHSKYLKPERPTPKAELIAKIEKKEDRKKRHEKGMTELVLDKVEAALCKIQPDQLIVTPSTKPTNISGKPEIIWCEISDVQLGTKVEFEKMGGINAHDWQIFKTKLQNWETTTINLLKEREMVVPIEGVVLALLGDMVEGHGIFRAQAYEIDYDVYKQVIHGAQDFAQSFARIIATFPYFNFTIYGVGGNHGRIGAYGEAPFRCNFDLVLYHIIELRLQAMGLKNVKCHFPESWFQIVETWDWTHLLVHGDDIKGWGGMPFYGMQRAVAKYQQVLRRPINYLHCGHHHAEASISSSLGDAIVNGNWIGANSFSKIIVEANTPVQLIHGISEDCGVEWTKKVFLQTRKQMTPQIQLFKHGTSRVKK